MSQKLTQHTFHMKIFIFLLGSFFVLNAFSEQKTVKAKPKKINTAIKLKKGYEWKSKWELGVGGFYGAAAHYPASNHYYELSFAPSPLFIYRFEKEAKVESAGLNIRVTPDTEFLLSWGLRFPVKSDNSRLRSDYSSEVTDTDAQVVTADNFHRNGMPGLGFVAKGGVALKHRFTEHVVAQFPVLLNIDLEELTYQGYEFSPEIVFNYKPIGHVYNIIGFLGWSYASEELNKYYYQVDPAYAINTGNRQRAAYNAIEGEIERSYGFTFSYSYKDIFSFFLLFNRKDYGSSANEDSPLHVSNHSNSIATTFSWYFYQSSTKIPYPKNL